MKKKKKNKVLLKYKKERVILSDVLPYELPYIFSNRYFYRFLIENKVEIKDDNLWWDKSIDKGAKLILAIFLGVNTGDFWYSLKQQEIENAKAGNNKKMEQTREKANLKGRTIPFTYPILHKPMKHRKLSIIHPINQIKVVEFYERYKDLILYLCSKSNFSIRYPYQVASYFYYNDWLHRVKLDSNKADEKTIELFSKEYESLKTYFCYKKYSNMYKFYDDYRFLRAEKKYVHYTKFDIESCFGSIYTHSISWAINGGKDIYKDHFKGQDDSFGEKWDRLMQEMNYNETNGIVIGPEFSRLFAEVILQHIDQRVEKALESRGYKLKVHYECYRYVDDYFFFYNDEEVEDYALKLFKEILSEFKLNISSEKTKKYNRPFTTEITTAKIAINDLVDEAFKTHSSESNKQISDHDVEDDDDLQEAQEDDDLKSSIKTIYINFKSNDFCKKYKGILYDKDVSPNDVLNFTFTAIYKRIVKCLASFNDAYPPLYKEYVKSGKQDEEGEKVKKQLRKMELSLSRFLYYVIDAIFFLYSMNKRINITLKVVQILNLITLQVRHKISVDDDTKDKELFSEETREIVFKKIRDEISLVLQTSPLKEDVQLETIYFLIVLAQIGTEYQLDVKELEKSLKTSNDKGESEGVNSRKDKTFPSLNAISIITLLYYFGSNPIKYQDFINDVIDKTLEKFDKTPPERLRISTEYIILALDLATCPYIKEDDKLKFLQKLGLSEQDGEDILKYMEHQKFMFTKWTDIDTTKELQAKICQEVYA